MRLPITPRAGDNIAQGRYVASGLIRSSLSLQSTRSIYMQPSLRAVHCRTCRHKWTDATLVVDTGATTGIVLTEEFAAQIEARWKPSSSIQDAHGVEIKTMHANLNVHFSRYDLGTVCVTATDTHMNGADGYIGMKVLRAFDIWLTPSEIGFRPSGLLPNESDQSSFKASGCKGTQCTLA